LHFLGAGVTFGTAGVTGVTGVTGEGVIVVKSLPSACHTSASDDHPAQAVGAVKLPR
jgi:hypothetical protein